MIGVGGRSVVLRPGTEQDLLAMAKVHRAAYGPGHFLALLPEESLVEYYRLFLGSGSRALVADASAAEQSSTLAGFAVFGTDIGPRIGLFKRRQRTTILRTALAHPLVAGRKVALGLLGDGESTPHRPATCLLLSIAVAGARRGVGSLLLQAMMHAAAEAGESQLGLYVRHSNVGAVNAYLRAGFRIVASMKDQYYMEVTLYPSTPTETLR